MAASLIPRIGVVHEIQEVPLIPRIGVVHEIQEVLKVFISLGSRGVDADEVAHVLAWFPGALEGLLLLADKETATKAELRVDGVVLEGDVVDALQRCGLVYTDGQRVALTIEGVEAVSRLCTTLLPGSTSDE